jgi:hypothetical protein
MVVWDSCYRYESQRHCDMSEKLLKLLLSELKRIRIVCEKCKTVVELDLDKFHLIQGDLVCSCYDGKDKEAARLPPQQSRESLKALAAAIHDLKGLKKIEIEFIVPDQGNPN